MINSSIEGYRSCVLSFGQTGMCPKLEYMKDLMIFKHSLGAGKTYTVAGPSRSISPGSEDDGIIGRSLDYLYTRLDSMNPSVQYSIRISCLEVYHENVYDLLSSDRNKPSLQIREHAVEG